MQVLLKLDGRTESGGKVLVTHNERLADPLDSFVQALQPLTKKRNKQLAEHKEIARLEFLGGMYTDPVLEHPVNGAKAVPVIPAWNILRCLQDGAKRNKRGKDVLRGVHPLAESAPISYDGPTDPEEMWRAGSFELRKSVGIQRNRTMRSRPMFTDWQAQLAVEVDPTVFDTHILAADWAAAGTYAGIGEMRPVWGAFAGTLEVITKKGAK